MSKYKTSDLVAFDAVLTERGVPIVGNVSFGEVGPGKKRIVAMEGEMYYIYEVYPIKLMEHDANMYMYEEYELPLWVDERHIVDHHTVRNTSGFHKGWIRMGFQPDVDRDADYVRLERIFPDELEYHAGADPDPLTSDHDDEESLRSADSYSTVSEDSSEMHNSFIVECSAAGAEEATNTCVCEFCLDMAESSKDFDRKWNPEEGSVESRVKAVISNIESKYT